MMSVGETTGRVVIIAGWTGTLAVSVVGVSNAPTVSEGKEVGARVRTEGAVGVEVGVFVFVGDRATVPLAVDRTVGVLTGRVVAVAGLVSVLVGVPVTASVTIPLWSNPIMAIITAAITRLNTRLLMAALICLLTMGNNKRDSWADLMT
jgi:hypothetical protein